jgi:uncharacterized protein
MYILNILLYRYLNTKCMMLKIYTLFFIAAVFLACSSPAKEMVNATGEQNEFSLYAPAVKDSFVIYTQLPDAYAKDSAANFPVVYMTDANFHFPMLAAALKQYEQAGLLPPLILVGIGYRSFELMDSLRVRDYMYPAAIPSDEMNAAGGGKNFDAFITGELIPYIDSNYRTVKTSRSLIGHSFGAYFSLYALLNQVENRRTDFSNFVAASPSLWYNDFYLNQLPEKMKAVNKTDSINIFLSVGGLEDSAWNIAPVKNFAKLANDNAFKNIHLQYNIYNNLEHMDVAQLTFIKGLQQFYNRQ